MVPPLVDTGDPDIGLIHRKVAQALAASEHPAAHRHHKKKPTTVTGGSIGSLQERVRRERSTDLGAVC